MKTSSIPAPVWYAGGLAVAGVVAYYLIKKGAKATASALNPANPDNIINTTFNDALQTVGVVDQGSSLGSTIYDWFHTEYDPNAPALAAANSSAPGIWDRISSWLGSAALGGAAPAPTPAPPKTPVTATYLGGVNTAIDPLSATSFSWMQ